jgi:DNA-directed RNA polymerase sigma subunit (sigma70/sigma32)
MTPELIAEAQRMAREWKPDAPHREVRGEVREMNEQYKIGESKFFLARMKEAASTPVAFQYYLSAFLSAAQSVIQYAREESSSKGRKQWYDEAVAGNKVLSDRSQTVLRHRFVDSPGSEDQIGSSQRYSKDLIGSSQQYIEELEKFVQKGMEEGILSG